MSSDPPRLVIEGITVEGAVFRPSGWIERLIGTLSTYGEDRRTNLRPHSGTDRRRLRMVFLKAQIIDGGKCLVVDTRLRDANPAAFQFLLEFIQGNRLRTQETGSAFPASAPSPQRI